MLALRTTPGNAEKVKRYLIENDLLDKRYIISKDSRYIYFPIIREVDVKGAEIVDKEIEKREMEQGFREKLKAYLTDEELDSLKTSYDIIGDIAILEIDDELKDKEKVIADKILETHKNINTVVKKSGIHDGRFRVQPVEYISGERKTEALHKENGIRLKLDVGKVYFSPRLSTERKRIMEQVGKGEEILVMFSGVAPYPCVLSRNTEAKSITGVEINPDAHHYALENVRLNKINNVTLYNDDVDNIVSGLGKFDRIMMPLPKTAEDFLDTALSAAKDDTIIHYYDFLHVDNFYKAKEKVKEACRKNDLGCEIISLNRCGQHAPRVYRICLDFRVKEA